MFSFGKPLKSGFFYLQDGFEEPGVLININIKTCVNSKPPHILRIIPQEILVVDEAKEKWRQKDSYVL